jgi:F-type H+-transporting ATPase subunit epsilon
VADHPSAADQDSALDRVGRSFPCERNGRRSEILGFDGYFGVLPGHTPLLAVLHVGELWYRQGSEKHYLAIAFGFAEVQRPRHDPGQIAEKADEIDSRAGRAGEKRAEERLARPAVDMDMERARVALMKSLIRLQVATRARIRS